MSLCNISVILMVVMIRAFNYVFAAKLSTSKRHTISIFTLSNRGVGNVFSDSISFKTVS